MLPRSPQLDWEGLRTAVMVADGGWSTVLRAAGLPIGVAAPEFMNRESPALVTALAERYLESGARLLTTNTFSANRIALARFKAADDAAELCRAGARIIRSAATQRGAVVAGCIGPTGKILAVDEISEADAARAFAEAAAALADGGSDLILLETFSELRELLVAVQAVRKAGNLPIIASLSFDSGPQRTRTLMGAEASQCAAALQDAGVAAIGSNCGAGPGAALPAVVALRAATRLPILARPNAGLPEVEDDRVVYRLTPEDFAKEMAPLIDAGANILGGCCGVTAAHIARLAGLVERRKKGGRTTG